MLNKRFAISLACVAVLLAGAGWVVLRPHEPVFQGKPLSFWLLEAWQNGDLWQESSEPTAALAVRQLGTNAVPFLVEMAGTKFSGWRVLWRMTFGASLAQMAHDPQFSFLHLPGLPPGEKQQIAFWSFKILGPRAAPAVPALTRLLKDEEPQVREDAAICLAQLGPTAATAAPALATVLSATNSLLQAEVAARQLAAFALGQIGPAAAPAIPQLGRATNDPAPSVRIASEWALLRIGNESFSPFIARLKDTSNTTNWHATVWLVANLGSNAQPAVPLFLSALTNPDKRIQSHALGALGTLHTQPDLCIPAITPFLRSTNSDLRQTALWSLRAYGTNAKPALPDIVRCLNDANDWTRRQATNALGILEPDALELQKSFQNAQK